MINPAKKNALNRTAFRFSVEESGGMKSIVSEDRAALTRRRWLLASKGRSRFRRRGLRCRGASDVRDFGDDFRGARAADRAVVVVDAALREREFAATGAGFRVEAVQRDRLLLGRELRKIYAGKLAGTIGVGEENLAGVFEGLDLHRHGHACQRANL